MKRKRGRKKARNGEASKKDRRKETEETLDKFESKTVKRKNWSWLTNVPHLCRTEGQKKKKNWDHPQEGKRRTHPKGKNHQLHPEKQNCSINIESSNILLPLAALL